MKVIVVGHLLWRTVTTWTIAFIICKMERAGFIGMRRKLRMLVKQEQLTVHEQNVPIALKDTFPGSTTIEPLEKKCPQPSPNPLEAADRNLITYLHSYNPKALSDYFEKSTQESLSPQEFAAKILRADSTDLAWNDAFGWSLLHYAADLKSLEDTKRLLVLRADPNAENCLLRTPLHIAVIADRAEVVFALLSYGAKVNAVDIEGWTPLHFAIHLGHAKCVNVLLPFSPDLRVTNRNMKTPIDLVEDDDIRSMIQKYEQSKEEAMNRSIDSIETDASIELGLYLSAPRKVSSSSDLLKLRELTAGTCVVREARPNDESGNIVNLHPKSAYS